ncbi:GGDEF domain-containing protein [Pseudovibrio brasiliensis]|uniref:diguanylate cyclase n=1 Tax=Pseudovibrio brasiliensis TaxID=1898042 RepID=A0ABX8APC5_9HYPH|nr:GGDEF domain-containing protein [Pseudovibrio brasiliensis]QUS55061.1 diguanylate cyclase [Pseudovibrio brasiliensis]
MDQSNTKTGNSKNLPESSIDVGSEAEETIHYDPLQHPFDLTDHSGQNDNSQPGVMFVNGNEPGRVILLDTPRVEVGRASSCQIKLGDISVSRRHLLLETTPEGVEATDLKSRNGVFVNNEQIKRRWLSPNDIICLGPRVMLRYALFSNVELEIYEKMYRAATLDPLTLTYNRRYLSSYMEQIQSSQAKKKNLSLILIDIDNFKGTNDSFGHHIGDQVLIHIATIIRSSVRIGDKVCRYGGEEFTVLLNEVSAIEALEIAERIRNKVEHSLLRQDGITIHSTVSIGVAMIEETHGNLDNLFQLADTRLFAAKRSGKNKVVNQSRPTDRASEK